MLQTKTNRQFLAIPDCSAIIAGVAATSLRYEFAYPRLYCVPLLFSSWIMSKFCLDWPLKHIGAARLDLGYMHCRQTILGKELAPISEC